MGRPGGRPFSLSRFASRSTAVPLSRRDFLATSAAVLGASAAGAADPARPRKLVMIAGSPSHGPGDHEFNAGVQLLAKCLAGVKGLETTVILNGYPKDDSVLDTADGILCYADGGGGHPLIRDQPTQADRRADGEGRRADVLPLRRWRCRRTSAGRSSGSGSAGTTRPGTRATRSGRRSTRSSPTTRSPAA